MKYIYSFICILTLLSSLASAQEEVFSGTQSGLTDAEHEQQQTYEHAGVVTEQSEAACAVALEEIKGNVTMGKGKGDLSGCDPETFDSASNVFSGETGKVIEAMIPAATKMYGMVFGAAGMSKIRSSAVRESTRDRRAGYLGNQEKKLEGDAKDSFHDKHYEDVVGKDGKTELNTDGTNKQKVKESSNSEEQPDHCAKIPMASEILGGAFQLIGQNKIEEQAKESGMIAQQKEAFYQVANTHKLRKKTAIIQAAGWGGTSACYIGYIARSYAIGMNPKWDAFAKVAAGAFLTTFFTLKAKNHGAIEDAVRKIGDNLPGPGECNPHSQTACFCGRKDSMTIDPANWKKYCVPREYADSPYETAAGCVTAEMESDTKCKCKANNSCFTSRLASAARGIGINNGFMSDSVNGLDFLGSGGFNSGKLSGFAGKMGAVAKDFLRKNEKNIIGKINGGDSTVADALMKQGFPAKLAHYTSAAPSSAAAQSSFKSASRLSRLGSEKGAGKGLKYKSKRTNKYSKGRGKGRRGYNPYAKLRKKKKGKKTADVSILTFKDEATRKAEITRDSSRPIFDIITHRYRSSAWKRFDVQSLAKDRAPKN